jgi:hypothetical protein
VAVTIRFVNAFNAHNLRQALAAFAPNALGDMKLTPNGRSVSSLVRSILWRTCSGGNGPAPKAETDRERRVLDPELAANRGQH